MVFVSRGHCIITLKLRCLETDGSFTTTISKIFSKTADIDFLFNFFFEISMYVVCTRKICLDEAIEMGSIGWNRTVHMLCIVDKSLSILMTLRMC